MNRNERRAAARARRLGPRAPGGVIPDSHRCPAASRGPEGQPVRWSGRRRCLAWLRVAITSCALLLTLCGLGLRHVFARADETADLWGNELARSLPGLVSDSETLLVNGERLRVASKLGELSVSEVLDAYERECLTGRAVPSSGEVPGLPGAAASSADREELASLRQLLTHRKQSATAGRLSCLALSPEIRDWDALRAALGRFLESGDLGPFASVRVIRVRAVEGGRTQTLSVWSEGSFRPIRALIADEGSPPDAAGLPEPPGARADLHLTVPQRAYGVHAYRTHQSISDVLRHYERQLPAAGWRPFDASEWKLELDRPGANARVFTRGSAVAYVAALADARGGGTRVVLLRAGGPVAKGRAE